MKRKSYLAQIEEYETKYGDLPTDSDELLPYLAEKLQLKEKDFEKIRREDEYEKHIPWDELVVYLPIIPRPCPRPRYSSATRSFYVSGAGENKKLLKYYITNVYNIIYTQTHFDVITYLPTPVSQMSRVEIYRAEEKTLCPTSNPDWDNLGKTYSDMVQDILLLNDNIISKGLVEKFYSIKPRVEITIKYQCGFDSRFNKRRVTNSTAYKKAVEVGNIIELYEGTDLW